jgi:hypothetical protein
MPLQGLWVIDYDIIHLVLPRFYNGCWSPLFLGNRLLLNYCSSGFYFIVIVINKCNVIESDF